MHFWRWLPDTVASLSLDWFSNRGRCETLRTPTNRSAWLEIIQAICTNAVNLPQKQMGLYLLLCRALAYNESVDRQLALSLADHQS